MVYGYIDESGAPGVAVNNNDFLVVSVVVFDTKKRAEEALAAIDRLRGQLGLKKTYEFHCSRNTGFAQKAMIKLMAKLDFRFITVSIKKTRNKKDASYAIIAKKLIDEMCQHYSKLVLEMDSNPLLYRALKRELKNAGINYKLSEVDSKNSSLVQLADYVVNLSAKKMKAASSVEQYRVLTDKQLVLIDIRN